MLNRFFPHQWIPLRALIITGQLFFYVALIVSVYALVKLAGTFLIPSPQAAALRKLYLAATLQGAFFCVTAGALIHVLQTLRSITCKIVCKK